MISSGVKSRQRKREPWTRERLLRERAIALGQAIDTSTWKNYGSALNSYLEFVRLHNFPVEPTPDTLSFYAVWQSTHTTPKSANSYLSGICQQLEPYFPDVRKNRNSPLVSRTMKGCKRLRGSPTTRKRALSTSDLELVIDHYTSSTNYDDLLFVAMLLTGFFALLRLGELTYPDDVSIRDPRKAIKRASVQVTDHNYQFFLPGHKADRFFEGNIVIVPKNPTRTNPLAAFNTYLAARDRAFPYSSPLWLTSNGRVPTRSFFMRRIRTFFETDVGGHSMRAGGATCMALNGCAPSLIQAAGRWASDAFQIYIRKNPVLLQAFLFAREQRQATYVHTS
jgi:hypothetical protein